MTAQPTRRNVLMIVIDQLRADVLHGALAGAAPTPRLDAFAAEAMVFRNHHTVTMPCGPARASLLTGQYAFNHRVVRNQTPLAADTPNVAWAARAAGYEPLLYGYSDQQPDPRGRPAADPAHKSYTHVMPGFTEALEMRDEAWRWFADLRAKGYDVPDCAGPDHFRICRPIDGALGSPALYRAEDSDTAFTATETIKDLDVRGAADWLALVAFTRPHPPFVAPAPYHDMIDPRSLPAPQDRALSHPFVDAYFSAPYLPEMFWGFDGRQDALSAEQIALLRATYLGLTAEVDHHIGRILDWLDASGRAERTLVVITADHGEMLGDRGMWGKHTVFAPSHQIPLMIRDPETRRAGVVEEITESIDVAPTLLDWIGADAPAAMNGRSLRPYVSAAPIAPRDAAFISLELGDPKEATRFETHWNLPPERCRAAIVVERDWTYAHFAAGAPPMLFHTAEDPTQSRDLATDPAHRDALLRLRGRLLDHRLEAAATGDALGR